MNILYPAITIIALLFPVVGSTAVPDQINFQGALVDNTGQQISGNVDLDFALFDAATSGNLLWSESHTGITVINGRYSISLGSVTPLTTGIFDNPSVYLEITVDSETLSPRERLLAVPYALKAQDTETTGGISNVFIQQIFQHTDYDGGLPANDDPQEGFADVDGDGLANFIDPDNDNDGILDPAELTNGSDINLVTPSISSIVGPFVSYPLEGIHSQSNLFTVTGASFLPGLTIQLGVENPTPQNLSPSGDSFEFTAGTTQPAGYVDLIITNTNSESATGGPLLFREESKTVFVTDSTYANAMSQTTAAADAICTNAATAAGLSGSYAAWYSDAGSNVKDRLPQFSDWRRVDGLVVAASLADLTDGTLTNSINITQTGVVTGNLSVATKTLINGEADPDSCGGANPNFGQAGRAQQTSSTWTESHLVGCTTSLHYYCLEK